MMVRITDDDLIRQERVEVGQVTQESNVVVILLMLYS